MTSPDDPREPSTSDADSPPGGGRSSYTWVIGLVAVVAVLSVVSLLLGGTGGEQNVPSR